jgi:uncharacterized RDD family membrane protein YckC
MKEINLTTEIKTEPNIGNRFVAGLIDFIIVYGFLIFLFITIGEPDSEGGYSINGAPAFIPIIFWFAIIVGMECFVGATIGNLIIGLKPVPIDGKERKLNFSESFKRHFLDSLDFSPIGYLVIKNTEKNQRIGDLWAKTIVVKAKKEGK